jgi:hypothetical protein
MKKTMTILMAACFAMAGFALGCGGYSSDPGSITSQVDNNSGCGGFAKQDGALFDADPAYCAAQVLHWEYDAAAGKLALADARVLLNCCGEHSMTIAEQDGLYVVTERDAPEFEDARCACMCVFDFSLEATGVPEAVIPLQIILDVTDSQDGPRVTFEGELDLTQGSGSVVISEEDVEPWCSEG